jgi:hypothetical protein
MIFMPMATARARFVSAPTDDFVTSVNGDIFGNGEVLIAGTIGGVEDEDSTTWAKDEWNFQLGLTEEYPDITIYLSFIGLGLAVIGAFLSIFGGASGMRVAGALLGIIGGGLAIAGSFLLWNFVADFKANAVIVIDLVEFLSGIPQAGTYAGFGVGWFATVCSAGLILVGSILLLLIRPKKY